MATTQQPMLVCRVRARLCALPVTQVIETLRPLPAERLAGMPAFVTGISMIRGEPVPIVDPGLLLGDETRAAPSRLLLLRCGARRVAFAVEEVLGVRAFAERALDELPPLLRASQGELVAGLFTVDAELVLVLQTARVLRSEDFRVLDEAGATQ